MSPSPDLIKALFYMGKGPRDSMNADLTPDEAWRLAKVAQSEAVETARDSARWAGRVDLLKVLAVGFLIYRAVVSFL